jgi:hypothetical protein
MQSADVMVAISNAIISNPILEESLEGPAVVIMVESPSAKIKNRVRDE